MAAVTFPAKAAEQSPNLNEVISLVPPEYRHTLVQQLSLAAEKQDQWLGAIQKAQPEHREAIAFLLVNMPERDLHSLSADFLIRNVELAYEARAKTPWAAAVPKELFFEAVLPYSNLNERRDDWRADFYKRFWPLVKDCKTPGDAAQVLNREVFKILKVSYNAVKRPKPDQSPYESTAASYASCSGLSIILVDACRAVGVPARVAGTPLWANGSGNHTWTEVWDGQWWFVGAAEPGALNQTWFGALAAKADDSKPEHRIYAASFRKTALPFLMVWKPRSTDYSAVDVTDFYVHRQHLKLAALNAAGQPSSALLEVRKAGQLIAQSDHHSAADFELGAGSDYVARAIFPGGRHVDRDIHLPGDADASIELREAPAIAEAPVASSPTTLPAEAEAAGDWAKMQAIVPRGYVCHRAQGPLKIDGQGDEPSWADAPWTEDFVDIQGTVRPAPRFRTRAKMLWDDEHLYIFAELEEPHVWATITKKNQVIFQDNDFEVFISPTGDNHNYHEFEMNALNTIWELRLEKPYRDGGPAIDPSNIDGLQSAVHVDGTLNNPCDTDHSWCIELAMPWKGLARYAGRQACPPKDGDQWRANFSRVEWLVDIIDGRYRKIPKEMRPEDNWIWSPQGVVDMHRPERWGYIQFSASAATADFRPDPTLPARDALMAVYYRQRVFHERFGRYAASLEELKPGTEPAGLIAVKLDAAPDSGGYTATARIPGPHGSFRVLHVRDDSKLWQD